MPEEVDFLLTIAAAPRDAGPRLVFADWLEERGQCDRSEFIRMSVSRDIVKLPKPARRRTAAQERERKAQLYRLLALRSRQPQEMTTIVPTGDEVQITNIWYWGGLPTNIRIQLEDLLRFDDLIYAALPIEQVRIAKRLPLTLTRSIADVDATNGIVISIEGRRPSILFALPGHMHDRLPHVNLSQENWQSFRERCIRYYADVRSRRPRSTIAANNRHPIRPERSRTRNRRTP
jgi:uncharacterized protein (TIGR02996 family)